MLMYIHSLVFMTFCLRCRPTLQKLYFLFSRPFKRHITVYDYIAPATNIMNVNRSSAQPMASFPNLCMDLTNII